MRLRRRGDCINGMKGPNTPFLGPRASDSATCRCSLVIETESGIGIRSSTIRVSGCDVSQVALSIMVFLSIQNRFELALFECDHTASRIISRVDIAPPVSRKSEFLPLTTASGLRRG